MKHPAAIAPIARYAGPGQSRKSKNGFVPGAAN
jgi:hypothetical protein